MVRLFAFFLIFLLISPIAHSAYFSPLPTAADALDGSYTITWKKRGSDLGTFKLYEIPPGGSQKLVYLGSKLSKSFKVKANGSYSYKLYSLRHNRRHPPESYYNSLEVNRSHSGSYWRRTDTLTLVVDIIPPPSIPASISVPTTDINGAYTISWVSANTATKYQLQERKNDGSWITLTRTITSTSYYRKGRGNGSYRYRVRAYNTSGWSGYRTSRSLTVLLPPSTPSSITVPTTDTNGAYTINWASANTSTEYQVQERNNVITATKYQLQESKNNGSWITLTSTITSTSYSRTGRDNGSYRYRVRAYNTSGWSGYRTSSSLTVLLPPSTPSSITVPTTDTNGAYTISWSYVSTATKYQLQESKNNGSWITLTGTLFKGNYSRTGRGSGSYRYRVRAYNTSGWSGYRTSSTVTVSLPPPVPSSISVPTTDTNGAYIISWAASSTATKYQLQEIKNNGAWTTLTSNTTVTSYYRTGRGSGSYLYRVRAYSTSVWSGYRTSSTVTVLLPPSAPSDITVPTTDTNGAYTISWASTSTATKYQLQESKNSGSWTTLTSTTTSKSYYRTGRSSGSYRYRVRAYNTSGWSGYRTSSTATVTLPPSTPGAISFSSLSDANSSGDNNGAYIVSWGVSSGTVTNYQLQQRLNSGSWSTIHNTTSRSNSRSGLGNGTYQYRAKACNGGACSGYTPIKTAYEAKKPGVPASISVSPNLSFNGNQTISWVVSSGSVTKYELDKQINGGSWTPAYDGTGLSKSYSSLADGSYKYKVRACKTTVSYTSCSDYRTSNRVIITTPPVELTATIVGNTPYVIGVGADGDAMVNIPLALIPGVSGFKPNLSLVYDSGRGVKRIAQSLPEDTIGYGWRLAGLSHIRRCVVNQSSSNTISLSNNDSLCLNGMPLVLASGTHFQVGAVYKTLIESYLTVKVKGSSGALWFDVTLPNGTTQTYGNGNGSRVDKNGGTDYQWSLNQSSDVDNNIITYSYYHDVANGINYPLTIDYDGATVNFEYRPRTDTDAVLIGSASQNQNVFLHNIKVRMNGLNVREYHLLDEIVSSKRRLNKLQQCGFDESGANITCLPPVDFSWTTPASTIPGVSILLSALTDSLGATHQFEYGTITGSSHPFLFTERPFGNGALPSNTQLLNGSGALRYVATKLRRDNGIGGYHNTLYAYQNKGLKSTKHWGFLGFYAQRITDEQSGVVTYTQHRVDYPYVGQLARLHQYNSSYGTHSQTLTRIENDYSQKTISHGSNSSVYPYTSQTTNFIYEGTTQLGATTSTNTPSFVSGLITQVSNTTQTGTGISTGASSSIWGDIPFYNLSGISNTTSNTVKFTNRAGSNTWLINFANEIVNESWAGVASGSGLKQKVSLSPQASSLKVASLTKFPDDPLLNLTTDYSYDVRGRTTTTTLSGANVASRTTSVSAYTAERYPYQLTNAKSQTSTLGGYDLRFGTVNQKGDPNNNHVSWSRDVLGRVISYTNSHNVVTTTTYTTCGSISCPTVNGVTAAYRKKIDSPITPIQQTYYDKLNRVIRHEVESFNGSLSKQDTWYDNQGRITKTSLPYFSGTIAYVTTSYDNRNRVASTTNPDGSSTILGYSASGNTVVVTITKNIKNSDGSSAGSQVKRNEFNVLGQLRKTTDAYGTTDATSVSYTYNAHGDLLSAIVNGASAGTTTTTFEYNAAGHRTKTIGPDIGTVVTTYTALGQIKTITDNKNQTTTFTFDTLNRLTERANSDGVSNWEWDTISNGKGKLRSRTNNNGFSESYHYNTHSQIYHVSTTLVAFDETSASNYTTKYSYDSYGRLRDTTYPADTWVGRHIFRTYNSRGYLAKLGNPATTLQTFEDGDAFGHTTQETYGNGITTNRSYNSKTGRLTGFNTTKGSSVIQNNDYTWRSNGTLQSRVANAISTLSSTREETFTYDALNRVKIAETYINGSNTRDLNYQYSTLGNITSKTSTLTGDTDVTGYSYGAGAAGPHAVTSATINGINNTLTYDANGAITKYDIAGTSNDKYIQYNANNQPIKIVIGNSLTDTTPEAVDEFKYDPDGKLYARKTTWKENFTKTENVRYIGNVEHITYTGHRIDYDEPLHWAYKINISHNIIDIISAYEYDEMEPNEPLVIEERIEYAHRDHLGSLEAVTDASGNLLDLAAFDPFGARKQSDWSQNISSTEQNKLLSERTEDDTLHNRRVRGFTNHQQLDRTGFIHMGGRVYDPTLGRFLSPDPIVQAPTNSQSWNRYSYVFNNPLSNTDPTGYCVSTEDWWDDDDSCDDDHDEDEDDSTGFSTQWIEDLYSDEGQYTGSSFGCGSGCQWEANKLNLAAELAAYKAMTAYQGDGDSSDYGGHETGGNGQEVVNNMINGGGLFSSAALFNFLSDNGAQWKGNNGKWYNLSWGGNQWAGARSEILRRANKIKSAGQGLFFLGTGLSLLEARNAYANGNSVGVFMAGSNILWGAAASFGGSVGLVGGITYFSTSALVDIPGVRDVTVTPIVDGLCSVTGNC